MVRIITFGSKKIWLFIEQLHIYQGDNENAFIDTEEYVCYFKFSEPTLIIFGELIRGSDKRPQVFKSIEAAETFASEYLGRRFHLDA